MTGQTTAVSASGLSKGAVQCRPWVTIAKRVGFCAAHVYYRDDWSQAKNEAVFDACSNRHGHGHNYELIIHLRGAVGPDTGMVINLTLVKGWLQQTVVQALDHKHLNRQIPYFQAHIPTLENINDYLWQQMTDLLLEEAASTLPLELVFVRLTETEQLWTERYTMQQPLLKRLDHQATLSTLTRRYDFSASHRLYNPRFTDEQNDRLFGLCNNLNGHGHNYTLEVTISGQPDPDTGMIIDIRQLDAYVTQALITPMDHKHLNLDVPWFQTVIPTAENIAVVCWQQLQPLVPQLFSIRVVESRNNYADYYGEWTRHSD